jgi:hypothetical protein
LTTGLEDSISGSASSSDEEGDSDAPDAVRDLLHRTKITRSRSSSPDAPRAHQTPLIWFHSPPSTQIGVYRLIYSLDATPASYLDELRAMQGGERKWALFMVAGGHFAGAVVRVSHGEDEDEDEAAKRKRLKRARPDTEVLMHKTFHRYTSKWRRL